MSHSVPSDSSTADTFFPIGADLVAFTHSSPSTALARDDAAWADAGPGSAAHGVSLDRLFGEPGDIFVVGLPDATTASTPAIVDDPLVLMTGLSDGLILPLAEHDRIGTLEDNGPVTLHDAPLLPEPTVLCDFGALVHTILPLADGWYWDLDKAGWVVDHAHA